MLLNRRTYVRSLIASALAGGSPESILAYSQGRWPWGGPDSIAKAAIGAMVADGNPFAEDLLSAARERSVLGRLNFRRVPFKVRLLKMSQGAVGYWVGQAAPKPLSKPVLDGSAIEPLKVSAILCQTTEAVRDSNHLVELGLQSDLEKAVAAAIDQALLDPNNTGIADEMPASITYGAPSIASTGSTFDALRADLSALVSAYQGDIESAALVMRARTALQIALLAGASAAVDLSASGGTLFGLPVATTSALSADSSGASSIALVDTQAVAYALENLAIESSGQTSLLMSDDPENDPGTMVSLWQTNTTAWKSEAWANWEVQRTGAVVLLSGVDYA